MAQESRSPETATSPPSSLVDEAAGACGDLGTFVPYAIGAVTVGGLAPVGVLFGFGAFYVASGLFFRIPMAVQPMKAVAAAILTGGLDAREAALTGLLLGIVLLVLALIGSVRRLACFIPQSVTAGLQLGLGLSMALLGVRLLAHTPWLGLLALGTLLALMRAPRRLPAAPLAILVAVAAAAASGHATWPTLAPGWARPEFTPADWRDLGAAVERGVFPQLPLTLTNAVVVTAALARELYPRSAERAGERNLALTSGLANLVLAPFGAMPMCHGAGGLQAHHRFGARTGLAPVLLGGLLLVLALGFSRSAAALFGVIPPGAMGALLLVAGADLALSRRLFDARPACWPAIGAAALLTLALNPAAGLAAGWALEVGRTLGKRWRERNLPSA